MTKYNIGDAPITSLHLNPDCRPDPKDKYPKARAIAAAFWISYFTLHWLTILEVVERSTAIAGTTIYFLATAVLSTMLIAGSEGTEEKKKKC